jgi:DNA-binding transcriptional regulator YhcF (GntR family)
MDSFQTTPDFTHRYLALEPGLKGNTFRVFHYLCYVLGYDNWIDISTVWLAEKLKLSRSEVSRAINILEKKGLLIRGEKIGRHYKWRLNPEVTWKGTAKARWNTIEDIPYSHFIEERIQYGDEHDFPLGYLRGLRPIEGGKKNISKEQIEREKEYYSIIWSKLYGEEYAGGVDWKKLSEAEQARLHIKAAKVKFEMEQSGEWKELKEQYFPSEEKPKAQVIDLAEQAKRKKQAQELVEQLLSKGIDLEQAKKLLALT